MQRRDFCKGAVAAAVVSASYPFFKKINAQTSQVDAVWVEGGEPEELLAAALDNLGGLNRFISKGDVVVIKPNIGWDRAPEYAATTNPNLIEALVKTTLDSGAKTVKVFDHTCNTAQRCYRNSQIEEKANAGGAQVFHFRENGCRNIAIKEGRLIKEWPIFREYLEADKIINVPIAKHHNIDKVTLGLKNLMGVLGGERGFIHEDFPIKIVDIDSKLLPTLTIIDAYRILAAHGPRGGNLTDVKLTKTLIASPCMVTADHLALQLFGHTLADVAHVQEAFDRGINKFDPDAVNLKRVALS
jgi:uncharacterized protein (DUF362 family)